MQEASSERPATRVRARGGRRGADTEVRTVEARDLEQIIAIDAVVTGIAKPEYWREILARYGGGRRARRFFLVAARESEIAGYIIGEVRDWEFGEPPCGWVFAVAVRRDMRAAGVATRLLEAICRGFRELGVDKVRTLLARENNLLLSFFRSQGMMAAPFIALEKDLE